MEKCVFVIASPRANWRPPAHWAGLRISRRFRFRVRKQSVNVRCRVSLAAGHAYRAERTFAQPCTRRITSPDTGRRAFVILHENAPCARSELAVFLRFLPRRVSLAATVTDRFAQFRQNVPLKHREKRFVLPCVQENFSDRQIKTQP